MKNKISLLLIVICSMGMANVPPPPTFPDPIVNQEVETKIVTSCTNDCTSRNVNSVDCIPDCEHFSKWGLKYGDDK